MRRPNVLYGNAWLIALDMTGHLKKEREIFKAAGEYLIGYMYVDHHAGRSLRVHRFCKKGFLGKFSVTANLDKANTMLVLRYDALGNLKMGRLTNEEIHSYGLPTIPDYMAIYDENEEYRQLRRFEILNPLRAAGFPDDIKFAMAAPNRNVEEVCGRLEKRLGDILYECELLNTPLQDFGVKAGDRVVVQIAVSRIGVIATFVSSLSEFQQNSTLYKWY